jgi:hypothetical protein
MFANHRGRAVDHRYKSASIFRIAAHNHGIVRFGNLGFPLAGGFSMAGPGTFPTRDGSRRGPRLEPAHSMNIVLSEDRVIGILPSHPDRETATFMKSITVARSLAQGLPIQPRNSGRSVSANFIAPRVIATGRIMATVIPGSV